MSKLYKCAKNCGSVEENDNEKDDNKIPACCGVPMVEIKEDELFGCAGCCSRCKSCGDGEK